MDVVYQNALITLESDLIQNVSLPGVYPRLEKVEGHGNGFLTRVEREEVERPGVADHERISTLIQFLRKKDNAAFFNFCTILEETGNAIWASKLREAITVEEKREVTVISPSPDSESLCAYEPNIDGLAKHFRMLTGHVRTRISQLSEARFEGLKEFCEHYLGSLQAEYDPHVPTYYKLPNDRQEMWVIIREHWTILDIQFLEEIVNFLNGGDLKEYICKHHSLIVQYSTHTLSPFRKKRIKLRKCHLLKVTSKSDPKFYSIKKVLQVKEYLLKLGVDRSLFEGFTISSVTLLFSISPYHANHLLSLLCDHIFALRSLEVYLIGVYGKWELNVDESRIEHFQATVPITQKSVLDSEFYLYPEAQKKENDRLTLELKENMDFLAKEKDHSCELTAKVERLQKQLEDERCVVNSLLEKVTELVKQKDQLTRQMIMASSSPEPHPQPVKTFKLGDIFGSIAKRVIEPTKKSVVSGISDNREIENEDLPSEHGINLIESIAPLNSSEWTGDNYLSTESAELPVTRVEFHHSARLGAPAKPTRSRVRRRRNVSECVVWLPESIDKIVPVKLHNLLDFVLKMAAKWDYIGIKLGLQGKVEEIRHEQGHPASKLTFILEHWLQMGQGVSWAHLIGVLESKAVGLRSVATEIKQFLHKQVPVIPDDIDEVVRVDVHNLMHLVHPFSSHWERIGVLLKLEDKVTELRGKPHTDNVKMTMILEEWAVQYGDELSWLTIQEVLESEEELLPLLKNIRQFLIEKVSGHLNVQRMYNTEESLTNSYETGQEIAKRVQANQIHLVQSLKMDAMLLAAIYEKELLIKSDTERLQAMLDNKTARCDIASYFINNVLFHWSPNFFKYHLRALADALADHDDQGNKQVAELFRRILSEFKTPDSSPPTSLEGFVGASDSKPFQPKD